MPLSPEELAALADEGQAPSRPLTDIGDAAPGRFRALLTEEVSQGGRNEKVTELAGFLRAKSFPKAWARDVLMRWNDTLCTPPLPQKELDALLSGSWERWAEGTLPDLTHADYCVLTGKPAAPDKPIGRERYCPITMAELMLVEDTVNDWIVKNAFARGSINMLVSPSAGAKTWLIMSLVTALATGENWLERLDVPECDVLYIDEEMGAGRAKNRLMRLGMPAECKLHYLGKSGFMLDDAADIAWLTGWAHDHPKGVVVLDTLVSMHSQDENSSIAMRQLFKRLVPVTEIGVSIFIAHHSKKTGDQPTPGHRRAHEATRGSGDIPAACDMVFSVARKEHASGAYFEVACTKNRLVSDEAAFSVLFRLVDTEDGGICLHEISLDGQVEAHLTLTREKVFTAIEAGATTNDAIENFIGAKPGSLKAKLADMKLAGQLELVGGEYAAGNTLATGF